MGKEHNIEYIFQLLDQGISNAQMSDLLAQKKKRQEEGEKGRKQGREVEGIVKNVIAQLPYVDRSIVVSGNKKKDRLGHDVFVSFDSQQFFDCFQALLKIPNHMVWIQVKSSEDPLYYYKRHIQQKRLLPNIDDVDIWMMENRQILLNGTQPRDVISEKFTQQVSAMNTYWTDRQQKRLNMEKNHELV